MIIEYIGTIREENSKWPKSIPRQPIKETYFSTSPLCHVSVILIHWYALAYYLKHEPDEVIPHVRICAGGSGHGNRFISHKRYGRHLVKAVYEYEEKAPVLVTVHFPYARRYFQGGGQYADKIF